MKRNLSSPFASSFVKKKKRIGKRRVATETPITTLSGKPDPLGRSEKKITVTRRDGTVKKEKTITTKAKGVTPKVTSTTKTKKDGTSKAKSVFGRMGKQKRSVIRY
tara:strand:+ start:538 stop:855 length:318 start_codon:yes stop_codon:yes gene_type:complete